MRYKITEIESVHATGDDYNTIVVYINGNSTPIECNGIEFDHKNGYAILEGVLN